MTETTILGTNAKCSIIQLLSWEPGGGLQMKYHGTDLEPPTPQVAGMLIIDHVCARSSRILQIKPLVIFVVVQLLFRERRPGARSGPAT